MRDLEIVEWATIQQSPPKEKELDVKKRLLPYAVVLSQECDLYQDLQNRSDREKSTQDKYLHSVLLGPAFPALSVKDGSHWSQLKIQCHKWNRDGWEAIKQNNNQRYHFLPAFDAFQVPDIVIDFKHFITAPREILLEAKAKFYVASLGQLFRDSLSQRFANFLARIALPDPDEEKRERAAELAQLPDIPAAALT